MRMHRLRDKTRIRNSAADIRQRAPARGGPQSAGKRTEAGSAILALLIVVAVIFFIMMLGPFSRDTQTQVTTAQTQIGRAGDAACAVNRNSIKTNLANEKMMNPGMPMNIEVVKRRISIPSCPGGGAYLVGEDGEIYCTKHFPPPVEMLRNMVHLSGPPPGRSAAGAEATSLVLTPAAVPQR